MMQVENMDKATKNTDSLTMLELKVKVKMAVTLKMITQTTPIHIFCSYLKPGLF